MVGVILRCRRTADLSQRELAALLEVSPSTVARWETGERIPSAAILARIADLAGYRLALFDHEDQPVAPAASDTVRDRGGRRPPAHLDVTLYEERWFQRCPEGGITTVTRTVHTARRARRDLDRDLHAHTSSHQPPGCVPYVPGRSTTSRRCRDIPTPTDHAHWWVPIQAAHDARAAARVAQQANSTRPDPPPCTCDISCLERPGCPDACPCQCEPEVGYDWR